MLKERELIILEVHIISICQVLSSVPGDCGNTEATMAEKDVAEKLQEDE